MPSLPFKVLLFLSSYFPLFTMLALLSWDKGKCNVAIGFAVIGIVGLLGLEIYLRYVRLKLQPESLQVKKADRKDAEVLGYIVTYLIPFLADFSKSPVELAALGLFFVVIGFVHINSNMIHINPMLHARGYHLYEVEGDDGNTYTLLTKNKVRANSTHRCVVIGEHIFLEL